MIRHSFYTSAHIGKFVGPVFGFSKNAVDNLQPCNEIYGRMHSLASMCGATPMLQPAAAELSGIFGICSNRKDSD
jgi:hypothetical protein